MLYDIVLIGEDEINKTAEEVSKKSALHYEPIIAGINVINNNLQIDNDTLIKQNKLYKLLLQIGIPVSIGVGLYLGLQIK